MKKVNVGFLLAACISVLCIFSSFVAFVSAETIVTAAQVNGTWRSDKGTFKVLALGKQKLRVEFFGTYEYKSPWGLVANIGEASAFAFIKGDTAIFRPDDADENCTITMRFTKGKLMVEQEGICGFGLNVSSQGTYRKTSNHKPQFEK